MPMEVLASLLFPTLVWTTLFDDREELNRSLLGLAYGLRDEDPRGVANTNRAGWQSHNDIQQRDEFAEINRRIIAVCRQIAESQNFLPDLQYHHQAWVNINPPGAYNHVHIHPNCHFSGVYYIRLGEGCGNIYFRDPRIMGAMLRPPIGRETHFTATEVRMEPEEGRMYVFPSWLEHGVEPNRSDLDRVGISFNVHVVQQGSPVAPASPPTG